jgi:drug/metabolite transporter (DMT)-like permease
MVDLVVSGPQPDLVLAFTLYPVTASAGQIAVLTAALATLIGFLLWIRRSTSTSFFLGALAGVGFVLSFDIVWVHWIFGLHHLTNSQMDLVLEPCSCSSASPFCGLRSRKSAANASA